MISSKKRKKPFTLIEIMVVMVLIGILGGIVAYSVSGSLEQGKVFKTQQGIRRVEEVIELHLASNPQQFENVTERWQDWVRASPLVRNPDDLLYDGWGRPYRVVRKGNNFEVKSDSPAYARFLEQQRRSQ